MTSPTTELTDPPGNARTLLTVEAAAQRLSIGRTTMYALLRSGAIESVRIGRLQRVPSSGLTTYITQLVKTT